MFAQPSVQVTLQAVTCIKICIKQVVKKLLQRQKCIDFKIYPVLLTGI